MQKEREHGGKAAVWMNVGRGGERGLGEGEKYGMRPRVYIGENTGKQTEEWRY